MDRLQRRDSRSNHTVVYPERSRAHEDAWVPPARRDAGITGRGLYGRTMSVEMCHDGLEAHDQRWNDWQANLLR